MGDEVYGNYIVIDQREAKFCDRSHVRRQTCCQTGRGNRETEDIEHLNMNTSLDNLYYACDQHSGSSRLDEVKLPYGAGRRVHTLHDGKTDNRAFFPHKQDDNSVRHFCIRTPEEIDINSLEDEDIMMASRQLQEGCSEMPRRVYKDTYTRESPYSAETVSTPDKSGPYNENYHHVRDDTLVHTIYSEPVVDPNMNVDQKKNNRRNRADDVEQRKHARLYDSIIPTSPVIDTHMFGVRSEAVRMCLRDQYDEPMTDEMDSYRHGQHAEELQPLSDNELCVRDRLSAGNTAHEHHNNTEGTSDSSRSSVPSSGDVKMMSTRVSGDHLSDRSPESMDLSQLSTPRDSSPEKVSPLIPIRPPGELAMGDESHIRKRRAINEDRHVSDSQTEEKYNSPHLKQNQSPNVIPPSQQTDREDGEKGEERVWSSSSFSIHGDVYEEGRESLRRPTARMVRSHPLSRQASLDYGDADDDLYSPPRHDELRTLHEGQKDGGVYSPYDDNSKTVKGQSQADLEVQYISRSRHSSGASSVASARDFGSRNRTINVPNYLQQQYLDSGIGSDTGSPMDSRVHEQVNLEWQNESKHMSGSSHRSPGRERGHDENNRHGSGGFQKQQSGSVKSSNRRQMDQMASPSQMRSELQARTGCHLRSFQATGPGLRRINRVESLPIIHLQQHRESDQTVNGSQALRRCYGEKRSRSDDSGSYTKWIKDGQCQNTNLSSSTRQDMSKINTSHQNIDKLKQTCVDKRQYIDSGHHPEDILKDSSIEKSTSRPVQDIHNCQSTVSAKLNVPLNEGIKDVSKLDHIYNDGSSTQMNDRNEEKQETVHTRQPHTTADDGLRETSNEKSCELSRPESAKGNEEIPDRHVQNRCDMSSGRNQGTDRGSDRYEMAEKYRSCTKMSEKDRRRPEMLEKDHRHLVSYNRQKCQGKQDNRDSDIAKLRVGQVLNETGTENIDQGQLEISNNSSDVISRETVQQKVQPRETVKTSLDGSPRSSRQSLRHLIQDNMSQQEAGIDLRDVRQQLSDREDIPEPLEHEERHRADRYLSENSQQRTNQGKRPSWDVRQGTGGTRGSDYHVTREYLDERESRQNQGQSGYYQGGEGTMPGHQQRYSDVDPMRRDTISHYDDVFYDEHHQPVAGMKQDRGREARRQVQGHRGSKHAEDVNNVHVDAYSQHGHAEQHGSRHTVKADVHANSSPVAPYRGHTRRGEYSQMSSMHGHSKYKQKPKYPFSRIQFDSSVSPKDYMEGPDSLYPMREQGGIQGSHDIAVLTSPEFLQSSGPIRAPIARQDQNHASWNQTSKTDGPVSLQDPADMNSQDGGGQSEAKTTSSSSQMHSTGHSQASHASTNHSQPAAANESQAQAQSQVNGNVIEDRKNLKNLPIEEVLGRTKAIVAELGKLEDYHRGDGMRLQKMLGDFYWDYTSQRQQIGNGIAEAGYAEITIKMLKSLNTIGIFKNDDVWFPAYYTYNTTWNYSDSSDLLAKNLAEADAVRLLTLNCSHKPYITNIHSKNVYYVMKASMSILHNIARNPNVKSYFKENKTAEVIMPFINMNDDMLRVLAMLTLAYIVEEEDNSKLIDETGTIKNVVMWISKALDNPKRRFKGFTPQELTQGLDKLAVNDGNKPKIIEEGSIPLFMKMIQSDNEKEQSTTTRCIWTLAFDKDVRKQLQETENMMSSLEKLSESQIKEVKKNAQGALWVLTGKGDASTDRPRSAHKGKNHIFISYSWNEQDKVLEIRDRLRAEGYVVWVDVDQMGGSTLQAMAEAVENAAVVLVCMSEKYKQSPNCRTEAEYTFQLRKDYIPLMMQKKYRPDGWLGMILGAKLFFDFSGKYPFEKSASGLLKELRGRGKRSNVIQDEVDTLQATADNQLVHAGNPHRNIHPSTELALPQGHQPQTYHMSREDVQRWLIAHQLDGSIAAFSQFDGRLLWQLREMKHEAADYFYQCLEKKLNMNLIDMLRLASALDTLH